MKTGNTSRPIVPPTFFAKLLLPFAIPSLLSVALIIFVGESWPRNIAHGSGLKLAGLGATALTYLIVWHVITRGIEDRRVHKFAAIMCGAVSLMGWPVWSFGVLPSVNGFRHGPPELVRMTLERTDVTPVSRSRALNHWAWLRPVSLGAPAEAGRYYISEEIYRNWNDQRPTTVTVTVARGLLGAQIVTRYE